MGRNFSPLNRLKITKPFANRVTLRFTYGINQIKLLSTKNKKIITSATNILIKARYQSNKNASFA